MSHWTLGQLKLDDGSQTDNVPNPGPSSAEQG